MGCPSSCAGIFARRQRSYSQIPSLCQLLRETMASSLAVQWLPMDGKEGAGTPSERFALLAHSATRTAEGDTASKRVRRGFGPLLTETVSSPPGDERRSLRC